MARLGQIEEEITRMYIIIDIPFLLVISSQPPPKESQHHGQQNYTRKKETHHSKRSFPGGIDHHYQERHLQNPARNSHTHLPVKRH
jgi:hypothetical protein